MKENKSLSRKLSEEASKRSSNASSSETKESTFNFTSSELKLFITTIPYLSILFLTQLCFFLHENFGLFASYLNKIIILKIILFPVSIYLIIQSTKLLLIALINKRFMAVPAILICDISGFIPWIVLILTT